MEETERRDEEINRRIIFKKSLENQERYRKDYIELHQSFNQQPDFKIDLPTIRGRSFQHVPTPSRKRHRPPDRREHVKIERSEYNIYIIIDLKLIND